MRPGLILGLVPALGVGGLLGAAGAAPAPPPAGELTVTALYEARLLIKLADLRTDQVVGPERYKAGARLATISALGVIKSSVLLDQAHGVVRGGVALPEQFAQTEKNGTKHRIVRFNGGGGPGSLADPLTLLLRAALQPRDGSPCLGTQPVYDGRQRYALTLTPAGPGRLEGAAAGRGLERPVVCRLGFRPIAGFGPASGKSGPFLRGAPEATFAYAPAAGVWVLVDVAVPTLAGGGRIALTNLAVSGVRPGRVAPASGRSRPR